MTVYSLGYRGRSYRVCPRIDRTGLGVESTYMVQEAVCDGGIASLELLGLVEERYGNMCFVKMDELRLLHELFWTLVRDDQKEPSPLLTDNQQAALVRGVGEVIDRQAIGYADSHRQWSLWWSRRFGY